MLKTDLVLRNSSSKVWDSGAGNILGFFMAGSLVMRVGLVKLTVIVCSASLGFGRCLSSSERITSSVA